MLVLFVLWQLDYVVFFPVSWEAGVTGHYSQIFLGCLQPAAQSEKRFQKVRCVTNLLLALGKVKLLWNVLDAELLSNETVVPDDLLEEQTRQFPVLWRCELGVFIVQKCVLKPQPYIDALLLKL